MLDRRLRQDAVAKIENMRACPESFEHAIDALIESSAARDQRQRIEIALQRDWSRQSLGRRARRELAQEIRGRGVDEALDQRRKEAWLAIGEEPRRRLVRRPAPCDHV